MSSSAALIKTRALLGKLAAHGIEATRATRHDAAREGPDALLIAADGRAWIVALWSGSTLQPSLLGSEATPSLDTLAARILDWRKQMQLEAGDDLRES